ncbi:MAG: hypothetical protein DYH08_08790 [Actinobacteria bacterium ATB1]|nr:hypothetical protein [Actinobacteria bacterium ATB1]
MPRHPKFEEHRWLGDKRRFTFYDCDDEAEFAEVEGVPLEKLQSFAPDTYEEARNRGWARAKT